MNTTFDKNAGSTPAIAMRMIVLVEGEPYLVPINEGQELDSADLTRVDPKKGYVRGNVAAVSHLASQLRDIHFPDMHLDDFVELDVEVIGEATLH